MIPDFCLWRRRGPTPRLRRDRSKSPALRFFSSLLILIGGPWLVASSACTASEGSQADGMRGVVATVHPLATRAGLAALARGGNAVDAAIAAALTLGVVDGHNSGLGGGCLILLRQPDGSLYLCDGRETAPAAATRTMFFQNPNSPADSADSQTGPLAVAVPGALAAYEKTLQHAGRQSLADLLLPAAEIAEQGFPIDRVMARNLAEQGPALRRFPDTARIFLHSDGSARVEGEILQQPELASTYRGIAAGGTAWFYDGPVAESIDAWMRTHQGLLRREDFAHYQAKLRAPIETTYRGYTIVGFPPPSSGGIHVAQILNILEHFDLATLYREDPAQLTHVVTEAMKLAFADRAYWLGDADFVPVPRGLLDKAYAAELARKIDLNGATPVPSHHFPPDWQQRVFSKHTTHITAADAEGNWVAITATINTSFGSKVVVQPTGLVLNNEMDDFAVQPGVPNAFGLVGQEHNAIAPGKRPLSSMSPTLVLRDGRPVLTLGAAGGPKIISQVVLTLVRVIDLQQPLAQAVAAPRWHHQWLPDRLYIESTLPETQRVSLIARGHHVEQAASHGVTQAIMQGADGRLIGVHDPRVPGLAAGLD